MRKTQAVKALPASGGADELLAAKVIACLTGDQSLGSYADIRAAIDALDESTARVIIAGMRDLPVLPPVAFQFKHVFAFTDVIWRAAGGGRFFTNPDEPYAAYLFIFLTARLSEDTPFKRAYQPIVPPYVRKHLTTGIMSPQVLETAFPANEFPDFTVEYLAHSDRALESYTRNFRVITNSTRQHPTRTQIANDLITTVQAAGLLRQELFKTRWLPALLPVTEYAQVQDLQAGLLADLYPVLYAGGYDLFHEQQQSRLRQDVIQTLTD